MTSSQSSLLFKYCNNNLSSHLILLLFLHFTYITLKILTKMKDWEQPKRGPDTKPAKPAYLIVGQLYLQSNYQTPT